MVWQDINQQKRKQEEMKIDKYTMVPKWAGWEYLINNDRHMYLSKRHLFVNGEAICGIQIPPCGAWTECGEDVCKKCENIAYKKYAETVKQKGESKSC
jgi:hypothetical protein